MASGQSLGARFGCQVVDRRSVGRLLSEQVNQSGPDEVDIHWASYADLNGISKVFGQG